MERDTQAGSQRLTGRDFLMNLAGQVEPAGLRTGFRACFLLSLPTLSLLADPASLVPTLAHLAWGPQLLPRVTVPWLTLECRPLLPLHDPLPPPFYLCLFRAPLHLGGRAAVEGPVPTS